jgi:hypothetical protein
MAKRSIRIWWIVGSVVMFAGMFAALFVSFETGSGRFLNGKTGASVALLAVALSIAGSGVILQLVAWIGALFNTRVLEEKTWFKLLLWLGIVGIVTSPIVVGGLLWWSLMLAYLVGGPDGKAVQPQVGPATEARASESKVA